MVTGEYPPARGGVGDYTMLLARHLCDRGASVEVLTSSSKYAPELEDTPPAVRRSVPSWGSGCWSHVATVAAEWRADILHLQYQAAAYGLRGAANLLPGYLRLRLPHLKTVTTFHDLRVPYLFPKAGPLRGVAVRVLDLLSHRTVVTNTADLTALGGSGEGKRWLVQLGANIDNTPPAGYNRAEWRASRLGAYEDTLVLAYFGFLNDSKGVDLLIEALRLLADRGIPGRLVIVGGDVGASDPTNREYARRIESLVLQLGVADRVLWTGFVTREEVSAHLLAADMAVLPFRDGASLRRESLLAAFEHGLPVVTTTPECAEPLLRNGVNVLMVPRGDAPGIANAVIALSQDPALRISLAQGAAALAKHFRWPEVASRHLQMYSSLLNPISGRTT